MSACSGDGSCLEQTSNNRYKPLFKCSFECKPIKCPNYVLCLDILPQVILDCNEGTCMNCAVAGVSIEEKPSECRICHTITNCISSSDSCEHLMCPDCYRFSMWNCKHYFNAEFPYPQHIENEYDEDEDNEKWDKNPIIKVWKNQLQDVCDAANFIVESVIEEASECQICKSPDTKFIAKLKGMTKAELIKFIILLACENNKSRNEDD